MTPPRHSAQRQREETREELAARSAIIDIYERHADAWVNARLREGSLYERGWLDRFCALVPPGGSVLDFGCGAGAPIAKYVSERGHAVTGVDSSPAMVAKFRAL